jgi:hypothetical protein
VEIRLERRHRHLWSSPVRGLTGILLKQRAMSSPDPPSHFVDFWDGAYGAIGV